MMHHNPLERGDTHPYGLCLNHQCKRMRGGNLMARHTLRYLHNACHVFL